MERLNPYESPQTVQWQQPRQLMFFWWLLVIVKFLNTAICVSLAVVSLSVVAVGAALPDLDLLWLGGAGVGYASLICLGVQALTNLGLDFAEGDDG